ncbi:restriction endonuclease subunit S [Pannonibacter phragmitetus]|uniref:restriction endonuclease subunit S n=1 Tax=Pannonibacter phragmitetus TaxID=121719 RepID=UPI003D2F2F10
MSVRMVPIGEVVEKISTWNPQSQMDGEFDYIDLSAIDQDTKCIVKPTRLSNSEAPSRARQLVASGDVLVATVRPNLNGVAKACVEHDGMTASTGFCVLRPRQKILCENYLFQWVKSSSFVKDMVQKATGASYPAVSDRIIKESVIPLPPLDEQKRIAAILDKADALRAKRRHAITLLDSLTQSIFLEMFGDPVSNPRGWKSYSLDRVAKFYAGNSLPVGQIFVGQENGYLLLKVSDLNRPENAEMIKCAGLFSDEPGSRSGTAPAGAIVFPKRGGAIATNKKKFLEGLRFLTQI